MSMEMNKALDLLREIRPSIPKEVLELWCKDRDAFLASHPAVEQAGANVGHGHVFPRADGVKMRCGGPGLCSECAADAYRARAALAQPSPKCVKCGGTGEADSGGVHPWGEPVLIPCDCETEQAEAERPEVAEVAFVLRNIGAMDAEDIDGDNVDLRFEDAEGRDTGCDVSIVEYAEKAADLFEQHDRIVGELRADRDSWAEQAEQRLADWDEMRKERDAALARVAEMERQEPVVRAYGVLPPFAEKVLAKLRRFYDCAEDFESGGVDIGRHWLDLLTQLWLLNRVQRSPALWEISQQGEDLLDTPQPSPAQAEVERPEVVGYLSITGARPLREWGVTSIRREEFTPEACEPLMTVAQHERIVKAWIERWKAYIELSAKIAAQRDAANARLHEVATACATAEQERDAALAEVERLRESKGDPSGSFDRCMKMMYERDENAKRLDAALARVAELETALTPFAAVADAYDDSEDDDHEPYTDMGCDDRLRLTLSQHRAARTALSGAPSQAQHSVPEKVRTLLSRAQCEIEHLAECLENVCEDEEDFDVREDVADGRVVAADIAHMLAAAPAQGGDQ